MVILMVIAYRLRRDGDDNLNLTSNDNPILTPLNYVEDITCHQSFLFWANG
jgi:hypothetical protein